MADTSKKRRSFVAEPMRRKGVSKLAGIGKVLSERMESRGIDKAQDVYGRYLTMKENKPAFQEWMKDTVGANVKQSSDCYNSLCAWHEKHVV